MPVQTRRMAKAKGAKGSQRNVSSPSSPADSRPTSPTSPVKRRNSTGSSPVKAAAQVKRRATSPLPSAGPRKIAKRGSDPLPSPPRSPGNGSSSLVRRRSSSLSLSVPLSPNKVSRRGTSSPSTKSPSTPGKSSLKSPSTPSKSPRNVSFGPNRTKSFEKESPVKAVGDEWSWNKAGGLRRRSSLERWAQSLKAASASNDLVQSKKSGQKEEDWSASPSSPVIDPRSPPGLPSTRSSLSKRLKTDDSGYEADRSRSASVVSRRSTLTSPSQRKRSSSAGAPKAARHNSLSSPVRPYPLAPTTRRRLRKVDSYEHTYEEARRSLDPAGEFTRAANSGQFSALHSDGEIRNAPFAGVLQTAAEEPIRRDAATRYNDMVEDDRLVEEGLYDEHRHWLGPVDEDGEEILPDFIDGWTLTPDGWRAGPGWIRDEHLGFWYLDTVAGWTMSEIDGFYYADPPPGLVEQADSSQEVPFNEDEDEDEDEDDSQDGLNDVEAREDGEFDATIARLRETNAWAEAYLAGRSQNQAFERRLGGATSHRPILISSDEDTGHENDSTDDTKPPGLGIGQSDDWSGNIDFTEWDLDPANWEDGSSLGGDYGERSHRALTPKSPAIPRKLSNPQLPSTPRKPSTPQLPSTPRKPARGFHRPASAVPPSGDLDSETWQTLNLEKPYNVQQTREEFWTQYATPPTPPTPGFLHPTRGWVTSTRRAEELRREEDSEEKSPTPAREKTNKGRRSCSDEESQESEDSDDPCADVRQVLNATQDENSELQEQIWVLKGKLEDCQAHGRTKDATNAALRAENQQLQQQALDRDGNGSSSDEDLDEESHQRDERLENAERERDEYIQELEDCREHGRLLQEHLDQARLERDQAIAETDNAYENFEDRVGSLETGLTENELRAEVGRLRRDNRALTAQRDRAQNTVNVLRREVLEVNQASAVLRDEHRDQINDLLEENQDLRRQRNIVHNDNDELRDEIDQLRQANQTLAQEREDALDVVDSQSAQIDQIDQLNQTLAQERVLARAAAELHGQMTDAYQRACEEINSLNTQLETSIDNEIRERIENQENAMYRDSNLEAVVEREERIADLETEIAELQDTLNDREAANRELSEVNDALLSDNSDLKERLAELEHSSLNAQDDSNARKPDDEDPDPDDEDSSSDDEGKDSDANAGSTSEQSLRKALAACQEHGKKLVEEKAEIMHQRDEYQRIMNLGTKTLYQRSDQIRALRDQIKQLELERDRALKAKREAEQAFRDLEFGLRQQEARGDGSQSPDSDVPGRRRKCEAEKKKIDQLLKELKKIRDEKTGLLIRNGELQDLNDTLNQGITNTGAPHLVSAMNYEAINQSEEHDEEVKKYKNQIEALREKLKLAEKRYQLCEQNAAEDMQTQIADTDLLDRFEAEIEKLEAEKRDLNVQLAAARAQVVRAAPRSPRPIPGRRRSPQQNDHVETGQDDFTEGIITEVTAESERLMDENKRLSDEVKDLQAKLEKCREHGRELEQELGEVGGQLQAANLINEVRGSSGSPSNRGGSSGGRGRGRRVATGSQRSSSSPKTPRSQTDGVSKSKPGKKGKKVAQASAPAGKKGKKSTQASTQATTQAPAQAPASTQAPTQAAPRRSTRNGGGGGVFQELGDNGKTARPNTRRK